MLGCWLDCPISLFLNCSNMNGFEKTLVFYLVDYSISVIALSLGDMRSSFNDFSKGSPRSTTNLEGELQVIGEEGSTIILVIWNLPCEVVEALFWKAGLILSVGSGGQVWTEDIMFVGSCVSRALSELDLACALAGGLYPNMLSSLG